MCLLLFAYQSHPDYRLILAANRDEFYDRPTRPAAFWDDAPDILAGQDLKAGGTWMGITKTGRFAAITNYREAGLTIAETKRSFFPRRHLRHPGRPMHPIRQRTP